MITIAIISDIHTTEKGKSKRLLGAAFEAIREIGADLVLSAGDNVNGCQKSEYNILKTSIQNHLGNIPIYTALGNHDYFPNYSDDISDENARSNFFDMILAQTPTPNCFENGSYSIFFNGIHIIFLDCIQNKRNFLFDNEQAEWLENELEKSKNDHLRIIVNHFPLAAHNLGTKRKTKAFMSGNDKLQNIIDRCGNIIYISGHTHNRIDSNYPSAEIDEKSNIYLNAGSIGNTQPCLLDMKRLKPLRDPFPKESEEYKRINRYFKMSSMELFLEINDDFICVRGYDFSQNEYITRCDFTFDV